MKLQFILLLILLIFISIKTQNTSDICKATNEEECWKCKNATFVNNQCLNTQCFDESVEVMLSMELFPQIQYKAGKFTMEVEYSQQYIEKECFTEKLRNDKTEKEIPFAPVSNSFKIEFAESSLETDCNKVEQNGEIVYSCSFLYQVLLAGEPIASHLIVGIVSYDQATKAFKNVIADTELEDQAIIGQSISPAVTLVSKENKDFSENRKNPDYKKGERIYLEMALKDLYLRSNYELLYSGANLVSPQLEKIPIEPLEVIEGQNRTLKLVFEAKWNQKDLKIVVDAEILDLYDRKERGLSEQQFKLASQTYEFNMKGVKSSSQSSSTSDSNISGALIGIIIAMSVVIVGLASALGVVVIKLYKKAAEQKLTFDVPNINNNNNNCMSQSVTMRDDVKSCTNLQEP